MSKVKCEICPHGCELDEGQVGFCRARANKDDKVVAINYGKLTSIALDPIEKKPLRRFQPGSNILSVGSFGCNLRCSFCQNYRISMSNEDIKTVYISPQELVERSLQMRDNRNIGIAFTYNEPLIGYEYVLDCAKLAKTHDLKIVLVTNGYINEQPLKELLPFVDAMNIDLKAFNEEFYRRIGGDLDTVKRTIETAAESCHVEVTTLIIPDENDDEKEIEDMSKWLSDIDKDIPLHISRFFPMYNMSDRKPTDIKAVYRLADIAGEHLNQVYKGNC